MVHLAMSFINYNPAWVAEIWLFILHSWCHGCWWPGDTRSLYSQTCQNMYVPSSSSDKAFNMDREAVGSSPRTYICQLKIKAVVHAHLSFRCYDIITWLLMSWRCKEPGHQRHRYWPSFPGKIQASHPLSVKTEIGAIWHPHVLWSSVPPALNDPLYTWARMDIHDCAIMVNKWSRSVDQGYISQMVYELMIECL